MTSGLCRDASGSCPVGVTPANPGREGRGPWHAGRVWSAVGAIGRVRVRGADRVHHRPQAPSARRPRRSVPEQGEQALLAGLRAVGPERPRVVPGWAFWARPPRPAGSRSRAVAPASLPSAWLARLCSAIAWASRTARPAPQASAPGSQRVKLSHHSGRALIALRTSCCNSCNGSCPASASHKRHLVAFLSSHDDLARPHKSHSNPAGSDHEGSARSCWQSVIIGSQSSNPPTY